MSYPLCVKDFKLCRKNWMNSFQRILSREKILSLYICMKIILKSYVCFNFCLIFWNSVYLQIDEVCEYNILKKKLDTLLHYCSFIGYTTTWVFWTDWPVLFSLPTHVSPFCPFSSSLIVEVNFLHTPSLKWWSF